MPTVRNADRPYPCRKTNLGRKPRPYPQPVVYRKRSNPGIRVIIELGRLWVIKNYSEIISLEVVVP
jgi:hypothetical protein